MNVLVAYATKYGATTGIAEHIATELEAEGHRTAVLPVDAVDDLDGYDAVIVGSAVYVGHWLRDATAFVRDHASHLAALPTWLFSSGPLGDEPTDARGRDLVEVAEPEEYREFRELLHPRGTTVFFGALVPSSLTFKDRSIRRLPVGRELLPQGDFRDWPAVEAWTADIAHALHEVAAR